MDRVKFIEHDGTRMLFVDYSRLTSAEEIRRSTRAARRMIRAAAPRSVLLLASLDGVPYTMEHVQHFRDAVAASRRHVRARAVYGLPAIAGLSFRAVAALTPQGTMRQFSDGASAREWLAKVERMEES